MTVTLDFYGREKTYFDVGAINVAWMIVLSWGQFDTSDVVWKDVSEPISGLIFRQFCYGALCWLHLFWNFLKFFENQVFWKFVF